MTATSAAVAAATTTVYMTTITAAPPFLPSPPIPLPPIRVYSGVKQNPESDCVVTIVRIIRFSSPN